MRFFRFIRSYAKMYYWFVTTSWYYMHGYELKYMTSCIPNGFKFMKEYGTLTEQYRKEQP